MHGAAAALLVVLSAAGCSASATEAAPAETVAATPTPTATPTPKVTRTPRVDTDGDGASDRNDAFPTDPTRSVQLYYPSGDPVIEGYPVLVETAQLDYRVANWIKTPQAVAVAPGLYVGYSSTVPDLGKYLTGGADGDCVVQEEFGFVGGACWNGVPASPAEPTQ